MRWNSALGRRISLIIAPLFAFVWLVMGASDERRLSIYSNAANYSLSVQEIKNTDYIGLLEALEPLGTVSAKTAGSHWKFHFNNVEAEFVSGKIRAKVHGLDLDLTAPFLLENGRGLVPVASLGTLLPQLLGGPVTLHETSRRLFIGSAAVHFTAQITQTSPPTLVMNFTSPVNPSLATEPGHLRMTFTREPLVSPGAQSLTFDNKAIPSAAFQENNGNAEVIVAGTVPLMARFSNDNKTITISQPASNNVAPPSQANAVPPTPQPSPAPASTPPSIVPRRYFAVIDPSHGGEERGAQLGNQLLEKDVTLSFARHLRDELDNRHLNTLLLRDGDATIPLDQRANSSNAVHPAIYLCIHASSQGPGLRIYNSLIQSALQNNGRFIDWNAAQNSYVPASEKAAETIVSALAQARVSARSLPAALRPLNNIDAPALAIEISPSSENPLQVGSPIYQQAIAAVIANALMASRSQLEAAR